MILTGEIFEIIYGKSKRLEIKVKENVLDFLMETCRDSLESMLKTSKLEKLSLEEECYLVATVENCTNVLESNIRNDFSTFLLGYDYKELSLNPEILGIAEKSIEKIFFSIVIEEDNCNIFRSEETLSITGKREDVKEAVQRFEKAKLQEQYCEKQREEEDNLREKAHEVKMKYSVFDKEDIMKLLKSKKGSRIMKHLADQNICERIENVVEIYQHKDHINFVKTEAYKMCQLRIINENSVIMTVQREADAKISLSVSTEVFVGDIACVQVNNAL